MIVKKKCVLDDTVTCPIMSGITSDLRFLDVFVSVKNSISLAVLLLILLWEAYWFWINGIVSFFSHSSHLQG